MAGSAVVAASMAWLAWTEAGGGYWTGVFGPMLGIGVGMAVVISPLTTAVMNAVGDDLSGTASGINNAAARVAGLLAVAVTGALMVALFGPGLARQLAGSGVAPGAVAAMVAEANRLLDVARPSGLDAAAGQAVRAAVESAYLSAFRGALLLNAVLAAGAAALGLLLPTRQTG